MARQPDSYPNGFWPSCDDQQPGMSIRPLSQADLAALLAHLRHDQDQNHILRSSGPAPVVAVRVRASVGRPGASAHSEYRRRRATELAIGLGGVLAIDTKQYRGQLQVDRDGMVRHGRHLLVSALRKTLWEADQADEVLGIADLQVAAIVAVHVASVPWGVLRADGVTVVPARRLPDLLQGLPAVFGPERVAWLADRARLRFRPAA
jgi:hypothetical protein